MKVCADRALPRHTITQKQSVTVVDETGWSRESTVSNGNKYLECAFMEAAHYAAIWEPKIKRYYQRKAAKTHKMVAKKTLANKLARACYQMFIHDQPFDVNRAFG